MSSGQEHHSKQITDKLDLEHAETVNLPITDGNSNDVPSGYWRSYRFLGSITAIILLANGLFIGYVMPVR
jgi:hypothetical protein